MREISERIATMIAVRRRGEADARGGKILGPELRERRRERESQRRRK